MSERRLSNGLTFDETYKIPVEVRFRDGEGPIEMRYAQCGSHEIEVKGHIELDQARNLHAYLSGLPGIREEADDEAPTAQDQG